MNFNIFKIYHKVWIYFFILLLITIQSSFYLSHITQDYKLMNEYKYMNEVTLLNHKKVNNSIFIDQNLSINFFSNNIFTSDLICFKGGLPSFRQDPEYIISKKCSSLSNNNCFKSNYFKYPLIQYSRNCNILFYEFNYLDLNFSNTNCKFEYFNPITAQNKNDLDTKIQFIKKNIYEQQMQIFDRYYIHENSFVLSPINQMELERPYNEIFSQYGFLSIKSIASIMKFLGGINLNNYEKSKKIINLLYYFIGLVFIFYIFKDEFIRLFFIILLGISFFGNTYYFFSYVPDDTNFKHFFDLFIIALLLKQNNHTNNFKFIVASVLSILSIWFNKEYGLFIFLSLLGTYTFILISNWIQKKKLNILFSILIVLIITGLISLKVYPLMENPSTKYFLQGFYSFPYEYGWIYILILFIVFLQWLVLFLFQKQILATEYSYIYIYLLFYTQFLYIYTVWHGLTKDLFFYSYIFFLPFLILYSFYNSKNKLVYNFLIFIILMFAYIKFLDRFVDGEKRYENVFKSHKLFKWEHKRAGGILATYSFAPFKNSIDLINKYNSNKKIMMISKYDNILAFLSEKYMPLPFFELRSSVVTKKEFNTVVSALRKSRVIFVDNDIMRDFDRELRKLSFFNAQAYYHEESVKQRIPKLKVLQKFYKEVISDYQLIEQGQLISVYKKKEIYEKN